MTHLLGTKYCLESLSKDVIDLHQTIQSILQKVGRIECTSWKFPSKNASDLDINELLEDYSYCKDEASNRLSHIIMFELVIDRFCFLLQVVSKLFEQITSSGTENRPNSKTVTATMSIGLVCKSFWSKLSQFQYVYQQQENKLSHCNQSLMDLEASFTELKLENDELRHNIGKNPTAVCTKENQAHPISEKPVPTLLTINTQSTQTFETAFVECEICSKLQSSLIEIGESVINICETQNMPSSISKHNKIIRSCKLSTSIVDKWSVEFIKDLKKVLRCVQDNEGENSTLKKQLEITKNKKEDLEKELSLVHTAKETLENNERDLSKRCNSLKELVKSYEEKQVLADNKIKELEIINGKLKKDLDNSTEELGKHKISIRALEQGMNSLSLQLDTKLNDMKDIEVVRSELLDTRNKNQYLEAQVKSLGEDLEKLKSENKVLLKHDQGLQNKQTSLLSRLEKLDQRCEELQNELSKITEEKQQVIEENEKFRKQLLEMQENMQLLKDNNEASLNVIQYEQNLVEMSEKLRLVVLYPVLGENYKSLENDYMEAVSCGDNINVNDGDVVNEMKRQIQANSTRISILEQQNTSLRNSLVKLEISENDVYYKNTQEHHEKQHNQDSFSNETPNLRTAKSAPNRVLTREEGSLEPRPPSLPRGIMQRPRSGGRRNDGLERLKNTSVMQNEWATYDSESNTFSCPDCGKQHISKRDLDIHRPFCFGRL